MKPLSSLQALLLTDGRSFGVWTEAERPDLAAANEDLHQRGLVENIVVSCAVWQSLGLTCEGGLHAHMVRQNTGSAALALRVYRAYVGSSP